MDFSTARPTERRSGGRSGLNVHPASSIQYPATSNQQPNHNNPQMLSPSQQTRLQHQHESLIEMTKGFSEEQLRMRPSTGKWSVFENIAHLASYQQTFIERLKRIEKEENPSFDRYVAENDPRFYECCEIDLHQLNEHLFTHRFIITNHISSLPEANFRRTGKHPVYGDLSVSNWLEFFLLHEAHHLFTIFKLLNSTSP